MCCILHNMILCFDNLDISSWMNEEEWAGLNPNGGANEGTEEEEEEVIEEDDEYENLMQVALEPFIVNNNVELLENVLPIVPPIYTLNEEAKLAATIFAGTEIIQKNGVDMIRFLNRNSLRNALVFHFSVRYYKGMLKWPKNMRPIVKAMLPIPGRGLNNEIRNKAQEIMERARQDIHIRGGSVSQLHACLYSAPSTLYRPDGVPLGDGLFSTRSYKLNDVVAEFIGEIISKEEFKLREEAGFTYLIPFIVSNNYRERWIHGSF